MNKPEAKNTIDGADAGYGRTEYNLIYEEN